MTLQRLTRFWLITTLVLLLSARLAQAGIAHLDCRYPMVFQGAPFGKVTERVPLVACTDSAPKTTPEPARNKKIRVRFRMGSSLSEGSIGRPRVT